MDDLPDELLLEIFGWFSGETLLKLNLVSKRWHSIISKSASTMNKLELNFNKYLCNPGSFNFNHQKLFIHRLEELDQFIDVFEDLANVANIQHLKISHCELNEEDFRVLFENFKKIKILELLKVQFDVGDLDQDENPGKEIAIRSLRLARSDHNLFSALRLQVQELEIIDCDNVINNDIMKDFLERQNHLESLDMTMFDGISTSRTSTLFSSESDQSFNLKCQVKRLNVLSCIERLPAQFQDNLIKVLKIFKNSLHTVKLSGNLGFQVYKFAFSQLSFVTSLTIDANNLPTQDSFYERLKPNHVLKVLNIGSTISSANYKSIAGIISHYPSIERLTLCDTDSIVPNDLFSMLPTRLKCLTHLTVLSFNKALQPSRAFSCLKSFTIKNLGNIEMWLSFVLMHKTLEMLKVGWIMRDFDKSAIEKIIQLPKLRELRFGGRFTANKRIFNTIKENYGNLRVLVLTISNYDEVQKLTFTLPCEKELFNPKCAYFDEGHDREPLND